MVLESCILLKLTTRILDSFISTVNSTTECGANLYILLVEKEFYLQEKEIVMKETGSLTHR
jgi:hypothetical protein